MQIGARAMKENKISVEEVDVCFRDIQESIDSQKEVEKALGIYCLIIPWGHSFEVCLFISQ